MAWLKKVSDNQYKWAATNVAAQLYFSPLSLAAIATVMVMFVVPVAVAPIVTAVVAALVTPVVAALVAPIIAPIPTVIAPIFPAIAPVVPTIAPATPARCRLCHTGSTGQCEQTNTQHHYSFRLDFTHIYPPSFAD